jgi:iron(III) transport system substrate-binding protein
MDSEEYFWYAGMLKYWGDERGRKYMEALADQQLHWRGGHGLLTDLMSAGEVPAVVVVYPDRIEQMKQKGQPVEWIKSADPILVNLAPVGIAARSPRPNSAKLFLNYLLSKEGQDILRKRNRISARPDVTPLVPEMAPDKLKLVPLDPEIPTNPEYVKQFRKVFRLN